MFASVSPIFFVAVAKQVPGVGYMAAHLQQKSPFQSQLSPCGHPVITHTPVIRTTAKSQAKINYDTDV